jgi:hypothetical protein
VLDVRTQKVIGLLYAKHNEQQAFIAPVKPLCTTWPWICKEHDVFQRIREHLKVLFHGKLEEQLHGVPFIALGLELGALTDSHEPQRDPVREPDARRTWTPLQLWKELMPPRRHYLLSSDVGTGKTTFVYWLALELLDKTNTTPYVMPCRNVEHANVRGWDALKAEMMASYAGAPWNGGAEEPLPVSEGDLEDFFERSYQTGHLVLLFDGLDQISGHDYPGLVETLRKIASVTHNALVISSRPAATLALEDDKRLAFLRLMPLRRADQEQYFGRYYPEARKLSSLAPALTTVPVLARMLRELIEAGEAKGLATRTQLYERYLNYLIFSHAPNLEATAREPGLGTRVWDALAKVSYLALAESAPQIQKISVQIYERATTGTSLGDVVRFGWSTGSWKEAMWGVRRNSSSLATSPFKSFSPQAT